MESFINRIIEIPEGVIVWPAPEYFSLIVRYVDSVLRPIFGECVIGFDSIALVNYGQKSIEVKNIFLDRISTFEPTSFENILPKHWELPIYYDAKSFDLNLMSNFLSLSKENIIDLHHNATYEVAMIGFLPGFVYLKGLPQEIHFSRKSKPSSNVTAGSVGIGGNQTGIYPINSPGGWNIIGRCPVKLFDASQSNPMKIRYGDKINFRSISFDEFLATNVHN